MIDEFNPGTKAWIVLRNDSDLPISTHIFTILARVNNAVIATPLDSEDVGLDCIMDFYVQETVYDLVADLVVFPNSDCYNTQEEAGAAILDEYRRLLE